MVAEGNIVATKPGRPSLHKEPGRKRSSSSSSDEYDHDSKEGHDDDDVADGGDDDRDEVADAEDIEYDYVHGDGPRNHDDNGELGV